MYLSRRPQITDLPTDNDLLFLDDLPAPALDEDEFVTKRFLRSVLLALIVSAGLAFAADDPKPMPEDKTSRPKQTTAASSPSLTFGFQQRVRTEDWNNIIDFSSATDDERRQMRYRTRGWLSFTTSFLQFDAGLADEFYKKYTPDQTINFDEIVFDTLSIRLKSLGISGLTVSVGRQDMQRGEGFILFDGTPGDGSRTLYFNAINVAYERNKSRIELMGILNPGQERFLGIIHDQNKQLLEWNEQALGTYYTNRRQSNRDIDAYYFYKKEIQDPRPPSDPRFQPDRHINTVGGRLVQRVNGGWHLAGEFAGQWGAQHANPVAGEPEKNIRAWGGYGYVRRTFESRAGKPYLLAGYWALSGDDPNDATTLHGFDPLFSRWPKWSELYIYSLVPERGVAYWTNDRMVQLEAGLNPAKGLNLRATFYEHNAFHPFALTPAIFGAGTRRGENYQVRADYTFNDRWKGHVLFESFVPGDYYQGKASGFFVQAQVLYTISKKVTVR